MSAASLALTCPTVSVAMITYNHEAFIAQAIESVLMQQTDFAVEIVIGEDCSPDGTREIVADYARRNPERIRPLLHEHNLGLLGKNNFVTVYRACRGQYVAILEGDDYWTDPHKLQKQVEFLEDHPECSLCFHNALRLHDESSTISSPMRPPDQKPMLTTEDILVDVSIPTCSAMFRNGLLGELPSWYYELMMGDWPLWVLLSRHGKLGYINETMSAYRIHSGGICSGRNPLQWMPGHLRALDVFDEALSFASHDLIEQTKLNYLNDRVEEYLVAAIQSMSPNLAARAFQDVWRQFLPCSPPSISRLLGRLYTERFFRSAQVGDYAAVRRSGLGLARYDRSLFRNRGVWSLLFEATFGRRISVWRRNIASSLRLQRLSHGK